MLVFQKDWHTGDVTTFFGWIETELNCSKTIMLLLKCLQFFLRLVNPHLCKPQSFVVKLL